MAVRTINSPGIQISEINSTKENTASQQTDYSIVDTVSLVTGFADKGEDYTAKWINSIGTFVSEYGYPKNEPEKYFYNAAAEVLNRGALLVTAKLPYNNYQKSYYAKTVYNIGQIQYIKTLDKSDPANYLSSLDDNLTSFVEITVDKENKNQSNLNRITNEQLDNYKTNQFNSPNKIIIVDITKSRYDTATVNTVETITNSKDGSTLSTFSNECLGIIPVIVSPANALIFQNILQLDNDTVNPKNDRELTQILQNFNCISGFTPNVSLNSSVRLSAYDFNKVKDMLSIPMESMVDNKSITESISKIATNYFPTINKLYNDHFDGQYLKHIGVVVFKAYTDKANNNYITLTPVESFTGSLLRNAKDSITKKSIFIDNIVNSQSQYINLFSTANQSVINNASLVYIKNQNASSLGFYNKECSKIINYKKSIVEPLTMIFDKLHDRNIVDIDIVCDAGVSNIAQFVVQKADLIDEDYDDDDTKQYDFTYNPNIGDADWKLDSSIESSSAWLAILKKFDNFVGNIRKDCLFLADGLRTLCLEGNEKKVRKTSPNNSVEKSILPNIRKLSGLNSTYSAGYCNWFLIQDAYSGDAIWCPPSIKAMGVMLYTDTYYNKWDAPAGLNRGFLNNVYDVGFNPSNEEAGTIYSNSWNYAISYPTFGIILEGQKTFQLQKTALDRINVRRLMLHIEKSVVSVAKYFLYEQNSEYLRQKFVDMIKPILEDAKNGNGISEYYIKCDEQNNPGVVQNNNTLVCDIAVRPIRTLEYIIISFNCTQQETTITEQITTE